MFFILAIQVDVAIDAQGKIVLPGLIDPHVHFNSSFMGSKTIRDYDNGTIAAAFGGVTTIIDFSTQPKGGSILENLAQKEEEARGKAYIDWSMHGIILDTDERALADICPTRMIFIPSLAGISHSPDEQTHWDEGV